MKFFEIIDAKGNVVAELSALDVRFIERGVDFQPEHFQRLSCCRTWRRNPPAVLNLPEGMSLRRMA